jgi:hypothetical protein
MPTSGASGAWGYQRQASGDVQVYLLSSADLTVKVAFVVDSSLPRFCGMMRGSNESVLLFINF